MKEILISSLLCLFLIGGMAVSQQLAPMSMNNPKWLIIESLGDNFSPDHTRLISSHKPIFRQLPNGQWEIRFKSNE